MTWNIYERPLFLGREGQRERTCRIPRWIFENLPDVDVIGFQVRPVFKIIPLVFKTTFAN